MRKVMKVVAKFMFYGLAAIVFLWAASLTLELLQIILPDDPITPFFGLALFDVGAIIWLLVFLFDAKGLTQRATALIAFAVDFLCSVLMVLADLFISGQNLASIPSFLSGGQPVYIVGIATAFNLGLIYLYHVVDPEHSKEIEIQSQADEVAGKGLKEAQKMLDEKTPELAAIIAQQIFNQSLQRLGMYQQNDGMILDGQARDVGTIETPTTKRKGTPPGKSRTVTVDNIPASKLQEVLDLIKGNGNAKVYASETEDATNHPNGSGGES